MMSQVWFFGKVLGVSALLAIAIKTAAPTLSIAATSTNALIGVFIPPLMVLVFLLWRDQMHKA